MFSPSDSLTLLFLSLIYLFDENIKVTTERRGLKMTTTATMTLSEEKFSFKGEINASDGF